MDIGDYAPTRALRNSNRELPFSFSLYYFYYAPNGGPVAGSQQDESGPFRLQACALPPAAGTRQEFRKCLLNRSNCSAP